MIGTKEIVERDIQATYDEGKRTFSDWEPRTERGIKKYACEG